MVEENVPEMDNIMDICHEDPALQDFINLDEDVSVCEELTDVKILFEVRKEMKINSSNEKEEQIEFPTFSEALNL